MKKLYLKSKIESPFDRQKMISWWEQDKLDDAKVMVVGAGAIGNETIKNLALLGVGYLFIVDFDYIEKSNLSRTVLFKTKDIGKKKAEVAAKRAKGLALAKGFRVDWFHGDLVNSLGTALYQEFDIVLGCLDNIEARLAVNRHCMWAKVPWIDAGIRELRVRVNPYLPNQGFCFECGLSDEELTSANQRYSCFSFKREAIEQGKVPTTQIAASLAAAWQTQEAIKYICGQQIVPNKYLYYQGTHHDFDLIGNTPNPKCTTHELNITNYKELPLGHQATVKELFASLNKTLEKDIEIILTGEEWSFIKGITCASCNNQIPINKPNFQINESDIRCADCHSKYTDYQELQVSNFDYLSSISVDDEAYQQFTLQQLGFSAGAFVTVKIEKEEIQVGLAHDISIHLPNLYYNE